jgi:hypothetical protein
MFSAVHPTTDIAKILRHVRFVPISEVVSVDLFEHVSRFYFVFLMDTEPHVAEMRPVSPEHYEPDEVGIGSHPGRPWVSNYPRSFAFQL